MTWLASNKRQSNSNLIFKRMVMKKKWKCTDRISSHFKATIAIGFPHKQEIGNWSNSLTVWHFQKRTTINTVKASIICLTDRKTLTIIRLLKEYYEIVDEPALYLYQDFFLTHPDFLQKCISNHETKQASKFPSYPTPSSNCVTNDVWKIKCCKPTFYFLLSYCFFVSHFTQVL